MHTPPKDACQDCVKIIGTVLGLLAGLLWAATGHGATGKRLFHRVVDRAFGKEGLTGKKLCILRCKRSGY
jgi:hypothetical protein